jgi:hypothetical protein
MAARTTSYNGLIHAGAGTALIVVQLGALLPGLLPTIGVVAVIAAVLLPLAALSVISLVVAGPPIGVWLLVRRARSRRGASAPRPSAAPPLNVHSQMATSPVVLAAYVGIRRALEAHSTFEPRTRFALMLAVSAIDSCTYTQAVNTALAGRVGFGEEEVAAILAGSTIGEQPIDALLHVAREASAGDGRVGAATWQAALDAGVSHQQLAEAYASIALAVFVDRYVNYADTPFDVPAPAARAA